MLDLELMKARQDDWQDGILDHGELLDDHEALIAEVERLREALAEIADDGYEAMNDHAKFTHDGLVGLALDALGRGDERPRAYAG